VSCLIIAAIIVIIPTTLHNNNQSINNGIIEYTILNQEKVGEIVFIIPLIIDWCSLFNSLNSKITFFIYWSKYSNNKKNKNGDCFLLLMWMPLKCVSC